jgi:hypothetical protein
MSDPSQNFPTLLTDSLVWRRLASIQIKCAIPSRSLHILDITKQMPNMWLLTTGGVGSGHKYATNKSCKRSLGNLGAETWCTALQYVKCV